MSQNIIRIDTTLSFHREDIDRRLYKREFDNTFEAEMHKIQSLIEHSSDIVNDRLDKVEGYTLLKINLYSELDKVIQVAESKLDEALILNSNKINDIENILRSRVTEEYVSSTIKGELSRYTRETDKKFERMFNQFNYKEQIKDLVSTDHCNYLA